MIIQLQLGDCVERMRELPDRSIGSLVSDPPYGIEFMCQEWDKLEAAVSIQAWHEAWLREIYRILQPGGVAKIFSGTRTFHRLAAAMTAVGFTIERIEAWTYGSGFPKSHDIARALDKHLGVERATVRILGREARNPKSIMGGHGIKGGDRPWLRLAQEQGYYDKEGDVPVSPEAIKWQGRGTALKPAWEPFLVGRK